MTRPLSVPGNHQLKTLALLGCAFLHTTTAASEQSMDICAVMPIEKRTDAKTLSVPDEVRGAVEVECVWDKDELTVSFMNVPTVIRERIIDYASQWEEFADISFDFGDHVDADIRVSTTPFFGSWSVIGSCHDLPSDKATMNLASVSEDADDDRARRTVLHEFGHALGLIHEHQNPDAGIPWDKPKVYAYYQSKLGWNRKMVDQNLFEKYSEDKIHYTNFDSRSIMLYPIPNEHTLEDFEVGWNTRLSKTDKYLISLIYD